MALAKSGQHLVPMQPRVAKAAKYFSQGNNNGLPLPVSSFFVSERHKVLFAPIGKSACSSLKTTMVKLVEPRDGQHILRLDVHGVTDRFNTGMQLKDLPKKRALDILDSTDYYKFAVVRDPVKRAISAYTEKFVVNRTKAQNQLHSGPIVQAVWNEEFPDYDRGITFRQFVEFITSQDPMTLDSHWIPQHLALRGVPEFEAIFRLDQLAELKVSLERWTRTEIEIGQLNKSVQVAHSVGGGCAAGGAADLLPTELTKMKTLSSEMFMGNALVKKLEQYFKEDFELYNKCSKPGTSYKPMSLDYRNTARQLHRADETEEVIWSQLNIYTKGFLGLDNSGEGTTGIVIANASKTPASNALFPNLRVEYTIVDKQGQDLGIAAVSFPVVAAVAGRSNLQLGLNVSVPQQLLARARRVHFSIRSDAKGGDLPKNLAHIASAEIRLLRD